AGASEASWQRLGVYRVVWLAQRFGELVVVGDELGLLGPGGKPGIHDLAALRIEPAVGVGLEIRLGDRRFAHLTSFSFADVLDWPSIIARSFSRARERRDITVPMGTSSVRATSS